MLLCLVVPAAIGQTGTASIARAVLDAKTHKPIPAALTRIASGRLVLNDHTGAPLSAQGVPFQVTAADFQTTTTLPSALAHMFPRPTAKFVHVYAAGRK